MLSEPRCHCQEEQHNRVINHIDTARSLAAALSIPWEHVFGVPGLVQVKENVPAEDRTEDRLYAATYDHFAMGIQELLLACQQNGWSLEDLLTKTQDELRRSNPMESQQHEGAPLSRRQAILAIVSTPLIILGRVPPGEHISPLLAEEVIMQCMSAIPACMQLYRIGEIAPLSKLLPIYTNHLTALAQQSSRLQKQAAYLASLSHGLAATLAKHRQDFETALKAHEEEEDYAQQAENPNLQLMALVEKAHTFLVQKRPETVRHRLLTCQKAEQYMNDDQRSTHVSPIIRARTYMSLSEAYASFGQDQEADRYIRLAYDTLPDHPEEDPYHIYTYYGHNDLFLFDGLIQLRMGDAKGSWGAFERLAEVVPETRICGRVDVLSRQTIALVSWNNLDESCKKLEETVTKALALDYGLRYHEAYETYAEMQRKWGREPKVRASAQLFTR